MAFLAAVSSFAMVSCGDDEDGDDPTPSNGIVTEASYGETDNSVYVEYPVNSEYGVAGSASVKIEWKFSGDKVVEQTSTTTCSSSEIAEALYKEALEDQQEQQEDPTQIEEDEDLIREVKKDGNSVIIYYEIDEEMTKEEAIMAAKMLASIMGAEVEGGISYDDLMDLGD